jgi:hypothetical protein
MLKIVATKVLTKSQIEQIMGAWSIFQCVTTLVKCQLKVDTIKELDVPCNVWTREGH